MSKFNSISAAIDKSDYEIYDDFLNIKIEGAWLDELIDKASPGNTYKGLIPTLLYTLYEPKERAYVWDRILPQDGFVTICPILMCPDDCDFSCSLTMVEIEAKEEVIIWNRIGADSSARNEDEPLGTNVKWIPDVGPYRFDRLDYEQVINEFRSTMKEEKRLHLEQTLNN